jgi:tripeptide aminopeptidase
MRKALSALLIILAACTTAGPRPIENPYRPAVDSLMADPRLQQANRWIDENRQLILDEWIALTDLNAPSGHEQERAQLVRSLLPPTVEVSSDSAGNLIAVRRGVGGGPTVVFDAHLDTVFQPGLQIKTEIRDGRLHAPGVGDNTRNVEALVATMRALDAAGIQTRGDLIFLFTVEEETTFRGIHQFLDDHAGRIDHLVALDGGYSGFTYGGIGTHWLRVHFLGPGGHTRSNTPPFSATLPAARTIARLYRLRLPEEPPTHLNIGMMSGSAVVNAKADDAWFTIDLRSTSNDILKQFRARIDRIIREEAQRVRMSAKTEVVSEERAAQILGHRESPLVKTAEAVYGAMGFEHPSITPTASNHSSAALRRGISAISTGAAPCRDAHAVTESCEIEPFYLGIKKILALELALAGVAPAES